MINIKSLGCATLAGHLDPVKGPVWKNCCDHKKREYLGSIRTRLSDNDRKYHLVDVYVYGQKDTGARVCLRYGHMGHEYMSSSVLDLYRTAVNDVCSTVYSDSIELIFNKMDFYCKRKKTSGVGKDRRITTPQ